jgi:hypothetical protein
MLVKLGLITSLVLGTQLASAEIEGVYGKDNRKDIYQTSNALHLRLAKSTAGMIPANMFVRTSSSFFDLQNTKTLEQAENLCTSEPFINQPVAPICSGFLVGPDILVTAGHCYKSFATPDQVCKSFAWVFDYNMPSASANPTKNIPTNNIYLCKQVVAAQQDGQYDFSIIKLDRKVVGREPLKFRTSGKVSNSASLVVIGHPTALPTKIDDNGKVLANTQPTKFITNLDTFHGNSGSAVFDASSGLLEGILIMGRSDYLPSIASNPNSCKIVNKCDETGKNCLIKEPVKITGEVVLRITSIASQIAKANQSSN